MTAQEQPEFALTADQTRALKEIEAARLSGESRHLLTGYAGSGKTTLMQHVVRHLLALRRDVAVTAPTHKAVSVLRAKLCAAGIEANCLTTHSLLSLQPVPDGAKTKLKRRKGAKHVSAHVVIIDECSMLDTDMMGHIRMHLGHAFVLFVGDPAQLPPVGEKESQSFATRSRSHLETIVRQAVGNPVLQAAHIIRASQGGAMDMSWTKRNPAPPAGVFTPNGRADEWMKKAFTSDDFKRDNDTFRYLCWTNQRVADVNACIRQWIYGDTIEPFSVGERVLIRQPVFSPLNPNMPNEDRKILFNTNEEAEVTAIAESEIEAYFKAAGDFSSWGKEISAWCVALRHSDGTDVLVKIPRYQVDYDAINERLVFEAKHWRERWQHRHDFQSDVARLQSVYAMTVHTSQGSTFRNCFVDVGDIRNRAKSNVLETQQLFYVAATRPTTALILVGV
jgi:exodeoxyribonuclease-5